eukprot:TRINITY_DN20956_c0_g1_i1.p1 TRINITY_DN20956_c0_g1~~TRINITY_DN20956_c0_g1_i1.p1  ORF type:complete len:445 (+),score=122.42 TRINITY_DN20956_c0_g1_i1:57-1337(+)
MSASAAQQLVQRLLQIAQLLSEGAAGGHPDDWRRLVQAVDEHLSPALVRTHHVLTRFAALDEQLQAQDQDDVDPARLQELREIARAPFGLPPRTEIESYYTAPQAGYRPDARRVLAAQYRPSVSPSPIAGQPAAVQSRLPHAVRPPGSAHPSPGGPLFFPSREQLRRRSDATPTAPSRAALSSPALRSSSHPVAPAPSLLPAARAPGGAVQQGDAQAPRRPEGEAPSRDALISPGLPVGLRREAPPRAASAPPDLDTSPRRRQPPPSWLLSPNPTRGQELPPPPHPDSVGGSARRLSSDLLQRSPPRRRPTETPPPLPPPPPRQASPPRAPSVPPRPPSAERTAAPPTEQDDQSLRAVLAVANLAEYEPVLTSNGVLTAQQLYRLQSPGRDLQGMGLSTDAQTALLTIIRDYWIRTAAVHRSAISS